MINKKKNKKKNALHPHSAHIQPFTLRNFDPQPLQIHNPLLRIPDPYHNLGREAGPNTDLDCGRGSGFGVEFYGFEGLKGLKVESFEGYRVVE